MGSNPWLLVMVLRDMASGEMTIQPWGMHEMQIDDPYGNAIRFGERVS